MSDNARQTIMDRLAATLAGATVASGFLTDVGENVYVWPTLPFDEHDAYPLVAVSDRTETSSGTPVSEDRELSVDLVIVDRNGEATAVRLRQAMCDVERVLGNNVRLRDGGLSIASVVLEMGRGWQLGFNHDKEVVGEASLQLTIKYRTNAHDTRQLTSE